MTTLIKPELSKKNPYWIDKHRYYELKHFCLQYKFWRDAYMSIDGRVGYVPGWVPISRTNNIQDPTADAIAAKMYYRDLIIMVEKTAKETDPDLADYIFQSVTKGLSYEQINAKNRIPCSRDTFYDRYRKFFWLLNKKRK
nr:MAG TPA: hypothetical protein [Caudoviricetes sp.]